MLLDHYFNHFLLDLFFSLWFQYFQSVVGNFLFDGYAFLNQYFFVYNMFGYLQNNSLFNHQFFYSNLQCNSYLHNFFGNSVYFYNRYFFDFHYLDQSFFLGNVLLDFLNFFLMFNNHLFTCFFLLFQLFN